MAYRNEEYGNEKIGEYYLAIPGMQQFLDNYAPTRTAQPTKDALINSLENIPIKYFKLAYAALNQPVGDDAPASAAIGMAGITNSLDINNYSWFERECIQPKEEGGMLDIAIFLDVLARDFENEQRQNGTLAADAVAGRRYIKLRSEQIEESMILFDQMFLDYEYEMFFDGRNLENELEAGPAFEIGEDDDPELEDESIAQGTVDSVIEPGAEPVRMNGEKYDYKAEQHRLLLEASKVAIGLNRRTHSCEKRYDAFMARLKKTDREGYDLTVSVHNSIRKENATLKEKKDAVDAINLKIELRDARRRSDSYKPNIFSNWYSRRLAYRRAFLEESLYNYKQQLKNKNRQRYEDGLVSHQHYRLRKDQIREADTSYLPMLNWENSKQAMQLPRFSNKDKFNKYEAFMERKGEIIGKLNRFLKTPEPEGIESLLSDENEQGRNNSGSRMNLAIHSTTRQTAAQTQRGRPDEPVTNREPRGRDIEDE